VLNLGSEENQTGGDNKENEDEKGEETQFTPMEDTYATSWFWTLLEREKLTTYKRLSREDAQKASQNL